MTPEQLRATVGVDRLPTFADPDALRRTMRRHHPADLRSGSVLADVDIDAEGRVRSVTVVPRPAAAHVTMVLQDAGGATRSLQPVADPAFGPAAEAVLMDTRFSPAMRDGQPVPFTLRMTLVFDPPVSS